MSLREELIDFLDSIREYENESGKRIDHDERESAEFVDIYLKSHHSSQPEEEARGVQHQKPQEKVCKHVWPLAPNFDNKYKCLDCGYVWPHTD